MHGTAEPAGPAGHGVSHKYDRPLPPEAIADFEAAVIVAGSRSYSNYEHFSSLISTRLLEDDIRGLSVIFITGKAPRGPDDMIIEWCKENGYPWVEFAADWDNVEVPGAKIAYSRNGKPYNKLAGYFRNTEMAESGAGHLWNFWDGLSNGTTHMRNEAKRVGLLISTFLVDPDPDYYARKGYGRQS